MSFQNEDDDEEDISHNLSSEEFNELTKSKSYNGYTIDSQKEKEINININYDKKEHKKENPNMPLYNNYNTKDNKPDSLTGLNFSYKDKNNANLQKDDDNINNKNVAVENNNNEVRDNKKETQMVINKSLEENKNINISESELSHNYQSFLTERLNLINQNLNKNNENEKNEIDYKEENKQKVDEYYNYNNLSKKDIMNYYFNFENKIENKDYNDTTKIDKKYATNVTNNINENNTQKNEIKINFEKNNKNNNENNKSESNKININTNKEKQLANNPDVNLIDKSKTNNKTIDINNYIPNNLQNKEFINNDKTIFNAEKNISINNTGFPTNKSIDTLESINIRKMDEEEEGRKLLLEDEYKKLTLLENEKNKLIEEEKLVRKKILEEVERQEQAEKKKEMRIKYLEKVKKREEDEKRLKDIKLRQEQELKEINELKNKKKLEEEKLFLIIEGRLKLNNQEINNYRNHLNYDNSNNDFNQESGTRTIYSDINIQEKNSKYNKNIIENKIRTISNNDEYNRDEILENKRNNYTIEETKQNNKTRVNKTITTSILNKNEKESEIKENNFKSFSPSLSPLSNKISTLSVKSPLNNYDTYEHYKSNMEKLMSLPFSHREDNMHSNMFSMKNIFMTNNPTNENLTLADNNVNYYDKKKKKHMKKKRKESNLNYRTNIYNDKKVFQKLIDNMDDKIRPIRENKENDFNEVNKIQEIATRAKNEIDKTINAIKNINNNSNKYKYNNTERTGIKTSSTLNENPYLKYGKKYLNKKKEGIKAKSNKQNLNLNSRNFNGYLSDNYDKIRYQKSFKGDDLNIISNDEKIDYNSREKNELENYQKENRKFNFNGVLSDNSSKFINYYQEIYGKK